MKLIVLVLFSLSAAEMEEEIKDLDVLWDKNLLKLRWEVFKSEGETMMKVDSIFFEVYNEIHERYIENFSKMQQKWNNCCANFSIDGIDDPSSFNTLRRLFNFCDSVDYFLQRIPKYAKQYLLKIYNGGILTENLMELNSKNFYASAIERFEFVLPMYHYNSSCVILQFPKLIKVYKSFRNNLEHIHKRFKFLMPKSRKYYARKTLEVTKLVKKALLDISLCKKNDCLKSLVDFKCETFNKCSIDHRLLLEIQGFYNIYNSNQASHLILLSARHENILELSTSFSDNLIDWENDVEKCLQAE